MRKYRTVHSGVGFAAHRCARGTAVGVSAEGPKRFGMKRTKAQRSEQRRMPLATGLNCPSTTDAHRRDWSDKTEKAVG